MRETRRLSWPKSREIILGVLNTSRTRWQTARLIGMQIVFPPEVLTRTTISKGCAAGRVSTPSEVLCKHLYAMFIAGVLERRVNETSAMLEYRIKSNVTKDIMKKRRESIRIRSALKPEEPTSEKTCDDNQGASP